jgi:hypothetical protein
MIGELNAKHLEILGRLRTQTALLTMFEECGKTEAIAEVFRHCPHGYIEMLKSFAVGNLSERGVIEECARIFAATILGKRARVALPTKSFSV